MESELLVKCEFRIISIAPLHFLRRWSQATENTPLIHTIAKFLCEESTLFYVMTDYLPSVIAGAAVLLARIMMNETETWVCFIFALFILFLIFLLHIFSNVAINTLVLFQDGCECCL
jgi:hypothetical protein